MAFLPWWTVSLLIGVIHGHLRFNSIDAKNSIESKSNRLRDLIESKLSSMRDQIANESSKNESSKNESSTGKNASSTNMTERFSNYDPKRGHNMRNARRGQEERKVMQTLNIRQSELHAAKIYVYELKAMIGTRGGKRKIRDDFRCEELEVGTPNKTECIFGHTLRIKIGTGEELQVLDTSQWALGRIYFASLMSHPRRTLKSEEADLFFIPSYSTNFPNFPSCPTAKELVEHLPFLTAENAKRHFWISPRSAWSPDVCGAFQSTSSSSSPEERLLAATTKLALEDAFTTAGENIQLKATDASDSQGNALKSNVSSPDDDDDDDEIALRIAHRTPPSAENLHSIPYPHMLCGLDKAAVEKFRETVDRSNRHFLVSAVWGIHGPVIDPHDIFQSNWVRSRLRDICESHRACGFTDLRGKQNITNTEAIVRAKLNSTFCLEPTGDTVSRKGIVDDILLGCIPVLSSRLQTRLWPWHIGSWDKIAVIMPDVSSNIISYLEEVPAVEVSRLRKNMASLIPQITYVAPGRTAANDALETTLAHLISSLEVDKGGQIEKINR